MFSYRMFCIVMLVEISSIGSEMSDSKIDILNEKTVEKYFDIESVFPLIERSLAEYSSNQVVQPARIIMPTSDGVLLTMPGFLKKSGDLGCKIVTYFPGNPSRGLSTILANIFLFDNITGQLQAIVAGTEITGYRTALASAVGTKYLHQGEKNILTIIGAGVQAKTHAVSFSRLFNFTQIRIWNRTSKKAKNLVDLLNAQESGDKFVHFEGNTTEEAVRDADVICTVTASPEPLVKYEWLKSGVQINAVGAGVVHYSELDISTYRNSYLVTDSFVSGEQELAGLDKEYGIKPQAEVGQIINGKELPNSRVVVFQPLGMAAEDVITAKYIYNLYKKDTSV